MCLFLLKTPLGRTGERKSGRSCLYGSVGRAKRLVDLIVEPMSFDSIRRKLVDDEG